MKLMCPHYIKARTRVIIIDEIRLVHDVDKLKCEKNLFQEKNVERTDFSRYVLRQQSVQAQNLNSNSQENKANSLSYKKIIKIRVL